MCDRMIEPVNLLLSFGLMNSKACAIAMEELVIELVNIPLWLHNVLQARKAIKRNGQRVTDFFR